MQQLYKLFRNNENVENVIILATGVADREGRTELSICSKAPTISTMSDKWKKEGRFSKTYKWTKKQKISVTTLDALISKYGLPVFCKIDIESFEESVLRGLSKPIPFISFEFTKEFFHDAKKCINHLLSIDRVKFNCSIGESMKLLFPIWVTPDEIYEKLDSLEDELL